ncbi:MAG: lytic transglycosylase domain-containing protein [Betaproteobacteria bacterium]
MVATLGSAVAHADIWGYVDDSGRSHVATEKLDDRYALFFKGGVRVDQPQQAEPAPAASEVAAGEEFSSSAQYLRIAGQPNASRFDPLIRQFAAMHKIDPALVKAVIAVESSFQPEAVSPKGARGLMQIIPDTGERYGVVGDRKKSTGQKLTDPATNLRVGTRYLRDLLGMFAQNVELALAAYNAGENAVTRYKNTVPPYRETQDYVKRVQQFYASFRPKPAAVKSAPGPQQVRFVIPGQRVARGLAPAAVPAAVSTVAMAAAAAESAPIVE